jgi:REP element-mobilizing transposase RayT
MPRRPRFDFPNTIHHISIRGVEKRSIFLDDADHSDLLQRLDRWSAELKARCLGWSFIFNHAHLVIQRGEGSLADLMARLTSGFALRFNRRYERVGHLLQGRYHSRLISDDADLRWTLAYTLGNPVRHGIMDVRALREYRWSAYAGAMGLRPARAFEAHEQALLAFAENTRDARVALQEAIEIGAASHWRPRDARFDAIVDTVCAQYGVTQQALGSKSADATRARIEVISRAVRELGIPWVRVAALLGIGRSSVHRALVASSRIRG